MRPSPPPQLFGRDVRHIHCVGLGGMGVGPLALYLAQRGFAVSGEDDALAADMRELLTRGGIRVGALAADCDLVVHSSAVTRLHPVCAAATARGIPQVRRGEMLAEITRDRRLVAVCGSHGKTTTTAMLITALRAANFPAGYVLGGRFADDLSPSRAGSNDWVVAEVDESDGTIAQFSPEITVALNLDWDHADYYRTQGELTTAFAALFARTRGLVLVNDACPLSARIVAAMSSPPADAGHTAGIATFGRSGDFLGEISGESGGRLTLRLGGRFAPGEAVVKAGGAFNAANATAALAAATLMGASWGPRALAEFPGVRRRQTVLPAPEGLTVVEDYAHHPAEIRALLGSLRPRLAPGGRLFVVFQPHRFSRTAHFKTEFAASLAAADHVYLLDVYGAGEAPLAGGTTADVYAKLKRNTPDLAVTYFPGNDTEFFRALTRAVRGGDLVAFVGAGDIDRRAREWLNWHCEQAARTRRWDEVHAALAAQLSGASRLKREEPLAARTTLRVGGAARIYAEPASVADLQILLREAAAQAIDVLILGRGSNLIVPDEGVDGIVLGLNDESWSAFEPRGADHLWVGAGLRLKNLCGRAAQAGLPGFEFLEGIPGTVGGALRMNAGAMGGWIFDVVEEVQLMSQNGEVRTVRREELHVAYRECAELREAIALGALLRARPSATEAAEATSETDPAAAAIGRQLDVYRRRRHETQPREPSAGCIFKNPPGGSAGRLIDECGLKGERVGDAEVSSVHANFIINRGHATGADVIKLVRRVRAQVRRIRDVELEPEVLLYGKKWEDVL